MPIIEIPDKPEDAEKIEKTLKTMEKLGKEDNFIIAIRRDKAIEDYKIARNQSYYEGNSEQIADIFIEISLHYVEIATLLNNRLPKNLQVKIVP